MAEWDYGRNKYLMCDESGGKEEERVRTRGEEGEEDGEEKEKASAAAGVATSGSHLVEAAEGALEGVASRLPVGVEHLHTHPPQHALSHPRLLPCAGGKRRGFSGRAGAGDRSCMQGAGPREVGPTAACRAMVPPPGRARRPSAERTCGRATMCTSMV